MSKEAIKNLLMDFMADYDPNKWSNDDVYEKYAEKIDNVRSMGELIAITELTKKVKSLEHRLSNCIELPIPIGEKCWTINSWIERDGTRKYELHENIVSGYDIYKSMINDKLTLNVVPCAKTNYTGVQPYLFATEEEAKKHLEKLKNANN